VLKDYKIFPEVPFCPHCDQPLSVSDVIPTMPITGFDEDEVVWKCGECGTEVKRVLDRQRSEPVILAQ
jgi:RNase P subunit RPR2